MAEKRSKASVGYKAGGDHCGACKHFTETDGEQGTCALVAGAIDEDYWCRLFARAGVGVMPRGTIGQGAGGNDSGGET